MTCFRVLANRVNFSLQKGNLNFCDNTQYCSVLPFVSKENTILKKKQEYRWLFAQYSNDLLYTKDKCTKLREKVN